jgi:hypothetical protein
MKPKVFIIVFIIFILFVLTPSRMNKSFNGINFDFNNDEKIETVTVNINGILTRDLTFRPKTFKGTISIDSNKFEITEPISLTPIPYGKTKKYYELYLDYENVMNWKLNNNSLYNRFGQRALWIIYTDSNFSYISIVAMPPDKDGGWTSSSEIITAPCSNRDEAISITNRLRTGVNTLEQ